VTDIDTFYFAVTYRFMQYYILQTIYYSSLALVARIQLAFSLWVLGLEIQRRGRFARSTLMSLAIRPWFEKDRIKLWLGAPLAAFAIVGGATQLPQTDQVLTSWSVEQPVTQLLDAEYDLPVITQEVGYGMPVVTLTGISQRYHAGHPGIDMRAPLETDVVTIDAGVIDKVIASPVGYGTHVYVTHEENVRSLYAHLGNVVISEGQYVTKGQPIAQIGMTGLSTGPHLHFEMYVDDKSTNPIPPMASVIAEYQKSLAASN
jgi:murein DD-endopeptidase MepM/ murein hydrolase activator NlpD